MRTLADLRKIKEKAQQEMTAREESARYRIVVAMGTCGIAAGSRNVMSAILDEIAKRNIRDIVVTQIGCLGYCDQEPLVQVMDGDKHTITYGKISPEIARRIVAEHITQNRIVTEYVFNQS